MTAELKGLDALVAEALNRKIVPSKRNERTETEKPAPSEAIKPDDPTPPADGPTLEPTEPTDATSVDVTKPPALSIAFAVNGVHCIVTVHVQQGGVVTLPPEPRRTPQTGTKVKGVRGAADEAAAAPEPPSHPLDGMDAGLVPAIPTRWNCPEHGSHTVKTSRVTKRIYLVCGNPDCDKMAPA